jgi:hypothetical protein
MPEWLGSGVVIAVGAIAVVLVVKYSEPIAVLAAACLESLGAPIGVLVAWKRKKDSESRIGHRSK